MWEGRTHWSPLHQLPLKGVCVSSTGPVFTWYQNAKLFYCRLARFGSLFICFCNYCETADLTDPVVGTVWMSLVFTLILICFLWRWRDSRTFDPCRVLTQKQVILHSIIQHLAYTHTHTHTCIQYLWSLVYCQILINDFWSWTWRLIPVSAFWYRSDIK